LTKFKTYQKLVLGLKLGKTLKYYTSKASLSFEEFSGQKQR
jgi:hypothetical protein